MLIVFLIIQFLFYYVMYVLYHYSGWALTAFFIGLLIQCIWWTRPNRDQSVDGAKAMLALFCGGPILLLMLVFVGITQEQLHRRR